ncbi:MAG TPA: hypothetical protein VMU01_04300 [Rhizomicrobium sp.]|nr:hypothetical protein [Rhizomicrobium sp.]
MNMTVHIPESTVVDLIGLDELQKQAPRVAARHWTAQRGLHRIPSRGDINLRKIAGELRHITLIKVLDGDFQYSIVGDANVRAYSTPLQNRRLSEVARQAPKFASTLHMLFARVANTGEPLALRGFIGRDFAQANFTDFESALLPLALDHETVDHILAANAYTMRHYRY